MEFKSIEVYSMNGTLVNSFESFGGSTEINLNVEKGIYLLRMNLENGIITKRILVN
jgi:hypothetical protein